MHTSVCHSEYPKSHMKAFYPKGFWGVGCFPCHKVSKLLTCCMKCAIANRGLACTKNNYLIWENRRSCDTIIGRAGASPPSHCAGALLYRFLYIYIYIYIYVIQQCHLLVPAGPHAMGKRKAGLITSGYLVKRGKDLLLSELACYKQVLASVL